MLPIDELVPPPIVGEEEDILVGEPARRPAGVVRVLMPDHAAHPSIVVHQQAAATRDAAKGEPREFSRNTLARRGAGGRNGMARGRPMAQFLRRTGRSIRA